jgi:hypothetical protein
MEGRQGHAVVVSTANCLQQACKEVAPDGSVAHKRWQNPLKSCIVSWAACTPALQQSAHNTLQCCSTQHTMWREQPMQHTSASTPCAAHPERQV